MVSLRGCGRERLEELKRNSKVSFVSSTLHLSNAFPFLPPPFLTFLSFSPFLPSFRYTKAKRGSLPIIPPGTPTSSETFTDGVLDGVRYYSGEDLEDIWVEYPWEQEDILEHNRLAALAKKLGAHQSQIVSEDQKKE